MRFGACRPLGLSVRRIDKPAVVGSSPAAPKFVVHPMPGSGARLAGVPPYRGGALWSPSLCSSQGKCSGSNVGDRSWGQVTGRSRVGRIAKRRQKQAICWTFRKPFDELEPSTPSLRWRSRGGNGVHVRSSAYTFVQQISGLWCVGSARGCPIMLSLMYPPRTRAALPVLTTDDEAGTPAISKRASSGAAQLARGSGRAHGSPFRRDDPDRIANYS
jgi:hypothetical protein